MEAKVKLATKKVATTDGNLKSGLEKKNSRLVNKYVSQLRVSLDELDQVCIAAEIEGIEETEGYIRTASEVRESANNSLVKADEYLLEVEESEEAKSVQKVKYAKLDELCSQLVCFKEALSKSAQEVTSDLDGVQKVEAIERLVFDKRKQMKTFEQQKVELVTSIDDAELVRNFEIQFRTSSEILNQWIDSAIRLTGKSSNERTVEAQGEYQRAPGLKLDRLAVPVFSGNVRQFARFIRDFEGTVEAQYKDPKIRMRYLQSQCLSGKAKELVRNLVDYNEAMTRLKDKYGNVGVILDAVLRDIRDLRLPTEEPNAIITLSRTLEMAWDDMVAIGSLDEFCNVVTLRTVEGKLPQRLQTLWAQIKTESEHQGSRSCMELLKKFIEKHRKIAEEVNTMRGKQSEPMRVMKPKPGEKRFGDVNAVSGVDTKKGACFRCGFTGHQVKECKVPASIKCRYCHKPGHIENACKKKHSAQANPGDKRGDGAPPPVMNANARSNTRLPIEEVNTECGPCVTLWDSGSAINLVSADWVKSKGIVGEPCHLSFKVVDGTVNSVKTDWYRIGLVSKSGVTKVIRAYGLDLASSADVLDEQTLEKFSVNLENIDQTTGKVQLLLGSGCAGMFPTVVDRQGDLCLMSSDYGVKEYLVTGRQEDNSISHVGTVMNIEYVRVTPSPALSCPGVAQVTEYKDFMSVEELGIRPPPICKNCKNCEVCKPASQFVSLKEHREWNVIKSKLSYDEKTEEWTTTYPYKKDPSILNDNYSMALKVLNRRENKLLKNPSLLAQYSAQIKDFVERGVIRKMTETELKQWKGPIRYVDHREVLKEGSTTPVRLVINSSFGSGSELSLNDILMKGPNVLTSLLEVLMRWRLFPVAFIGDISKMYHNVRTGELEANVRRLLWRECEQTRPPDIYCFEKVTFGDRPAGCIVVSALQATAEMFSHISTKASQVLKQDSYMDDTLSGENSLEEAKDLASDIQAIAGKGGFKYKKMVFSGEYEENGESKPSEKALGVIWEPSEDKIKVSIELNHNKKNRGKRSEAERIEAIPYTRRICLRLVNGIFDPLGMTAPVTVKLKILMKNQFSAQEKYKKWDTLLEPKDAMEWIKLLQEVMKLKDIAIPRHPLNAPYPDPQAGGNHILICFTDASQEAMCAAVYIRYEAESGEVDVGLIAAKTKVAPVKPTTMPRMELCASLLGARLSSKITQMIENECFRFDSKFFFMDSTIALGVINKCHLSDEFNGNCSAEIRGKTQDFTFAWVDTKENIADIGTRGSGVEEIGPSSRWQKGPEWLLKPTAEWPIKIHQLETLPVVDFVQHEKPIIDAEKYSDVGRLHKVTALCLKFAHSRGTGRKVVGDWRKVKLTAEDLAKAELFWIKEVSKSTIKKYDAGKLQSLRPAKVWDEKGQFAKVVTSGRLGQLLKIGYDATELTILDPEHPYTKLVLKDYHERDHGGDDRAVWRSREKFWIPQARKEVKKIRSKCYRCRLLNKRMAEQIMSPLPNQRVLPTPPWTYTSVDLFGPLEHTDMVRKRLKEKSWGIIFTCMVSRAVHLDLTQAYDTDAVIQALRRFMAIRGTPREMLSDQGSQLIACSKEVSIILELIDWHIIEGWCSRRSIEWKCVPPQGQHMNGVTEALVRSTKHLLKQAIEGKRMSFVEIQTVLYEVSQILNSRPLGTYSRPGEDPLDGGPITPNHLLLGRATSSIPEFSYTNVKNTKRVRFLQTVVQEFWKKWKVQVFHSLVPQYKWHKSMRNVQVGDVVLIGDDAAIVGEFKLGQVEEVKVSKDGMVRSCRVRCVSRTEGKITKSVLERPIHKLCVIVPKDEQ